MQRTRKDISLKNIETTKKYMKICSTSLITMEMQIKTTEMSPHTPEKTEFTGPSAGRRKMQRKVQETGRESPGRLIRALVRLPCVEMTPV